MTTTATKRAVGYIRVSTERQADEDRVSLDEQKADIAAYCAHKGYMIVDWYCDVGSGASKRRKDFQRMLRDAPTNKYDAVVAWKSDRLSRGTYPATALMEAIEGTNIHLEAVKDTIDSDTFELYAWVGKRELRAISQRARMGRRGKAKQGIWSGAVKFGYSLEGEAGRKRPVVNEDEAAIVRRMFYEYVGGVGVYTIAQNLRRDGVATRNGNDWTMPRVWDVIRDPVYIGRGYHGRVQRGKRDNGERDVTHLQRMPEDTWIEIEYPTVIDVETFSKAQIQRHNPVRNAKPVKYHDVVYLAKSLVWCGHCGRRYSTSTSTAKRTWKRRDGTIMERRRKTPHGVYVSANATLDGADCPRPRIGHVKFDAEIWQTVKDFLMKRERIEAMIAERKRQIEEVGTLPELLRAQKQLGDCKHKEARALDLYMDGRYDKAYLDLKLREIREAKDYYEMEVARLERECANSTMAIQMLEDFLAAAEQITSRLDTMTLKERQEAVRLVVDRVIVWDRDTSEVVMALDFGRVNSFARTEPLGCVNYATISVPLVAA